MQSAVALFLLTCVAVSAQTPAQYSSPSPGQIGAQTPALQAPNPPPQPSPLSKANSTEVVIRYVGGKGYTPDDTYKLYVDENMIMREWSYLKASKAPAARITDWSDYQTIGGIELSLMREGRDGFKVWFTGVKIE